MHRRRLLRGQLCGDDRTQTSQFCASLYLLYLLYLRARAELVRWEKLQDGEERFRNDTCSNGVDRVKLFRLVVNIGKFLILIGFVTVDGLL